MKKIFLFMYCSAVAGTAFAQRVSPAGNTLQSLLKIDGGIQGFGITYEPRIARSLVLDLSAGVGGGYDIAEGSIDYNVTRPALYFAVTPKYFYNLKKRLKENRNTGLNAGNYIGIRLKYATPIFAKTDHVRNSVLVNIHWGIQRAMSPHWSFNTHAGIGYAQDIDYNFGTIYPSVDFTCSYVFIKSKK